MDFLVNKFLRKEIWCRFGEEIRHGKFKAGTLKGRASQATRDPMNRLHWHQWNGEQGGPLLGINRIVMNCITIISGLLNG